MMQCVAVYYSVLQCVAVHCSVLRCIAVCCGVLQCFETLMLFPTVLRVAVCCVFWCVAWCSVVQFVAVRCD